MSDTVHEPSTRSQNTIDKYEKLYKKDKLLNFLNLSTQTLNKESKLLAFYNMK